MEIADSYNQIPKECLKKPTYSPKPMNRRIDCYYLPKDKLVIVGQADNNYIYWVSKTRLHDVETNGAILEAVAYDEFPLCASSGEKYHILEISYDEFQSYYVESLTLGTNYKNELSWRGTFENYECRKGNGAFIAKRIEALPKLLEEFCEAREAGHNYKAVLKEYLNQLRKVVGDPIEDYDRVSCILKLLENEKYLLQSKDSEIVKIYTEILKLGSDKYNAYMNRVR